MGVLLDRRHRSAEALHNPAGGLDQVIVARMVAAGAAVWAAPGIELAENQSRIVSLQRLVVQPERGKLLARGVDREDIDVLDELGQQLGAIEWIEQWLQLVVGKIRGETGRPEAFDLSLPQRPVALGQILDTHGIIGQCLHTRRRQGAPGRRLGFRTPPER
jgi:hypothetical protein